MEEIVAAHILKQFSRLIQQGPKSPQKYLRYRYAFFYLDYGYANDFAFSESFIYWKNPVLEFCPQNYFGHSDCSSFQHRISP